MQESDRTLTLDYVIKAVRVNEVSKAGTTAMKSDISEINAVRARPTYDSYSHRSSFGDSVKCSKCGKVHGKSKFPAF